MSDTDVAAARQDALVGNRLALAGVVLYLLEWVVIFAAPFAGPLGPGEDAATLVEEYAADADAAALSASWFAVCLVGRVLFLAGVKASMRHRPREWPLLDLAIAAMAVSVVLEVAGYGIVAAAARLAADGADDGVVVALDHAAYWLVLLLFGPVGVSVVAGAFGMLRSRLFPRWLPWVGLVGGAVAVVGTVAAGATVGAGDAGVGDAVAAPGVLAMWVWMVATGVVLWRAARVRTPRTP
jgi:hypothetical protein